MQILALEQGSPQWLALRQSKISGTDTAILLGSNIWKSKLDLWKQKLGLKEPDLQNEKMKRGIALEEPARKLLNKYVGIDFEPVVVISNKNPHMMASLDGLSPCGQFMCEIKCPGLKNHERAIEGVIADYYQDQINHCLLVTGCKKCYFCSYYPEHEREIVIIEVFPDLEKQTLIIEKGLEFYIQMCTMQPPIEWQFKERK